LHIGAVNNSLANIAEDNLRVITRKSGSDILAKFIVGAPDRGPTAFHIGRVNKSPIASSLKETSADG
jgi:hypothetical protein